MPTHVTKSQPASLKNIESKLDPYRKEIAELRRTGYTLAAIRDLLAVMNVEISISRLSTYIGRRDEALEGGDAVMQKRMLPYDVCEDPLAILLLNQIKAQADRCK